MSSARIVLYEDAAARLLEPFALTRPTSELRAGAALLRDRWEQYAVGAVIGRIGAPHLATFDEPGCPPTTQGVISTGTIIANARFAPALHAPLGDADAWTADGRIVAVRLSSDIDAGRFADGSATLELLAGTAPRTAPLPGWWIDRAWDLIRHLSAMLAADIPLMAAPLPTQDVRALHGVEVVGAHSVCIEDGAVVEPFVLLDAQQGPILVRRGAHVQAFTRLVGPIYVGRDSAIHGGRVAASSIGEQCRVHGEVSVCVFVGQANKGHDGFVGHSVIGRWANLGAGTTTSNLKNSYGTVQMWTPAGIEDTGLQFLGSLIGDHAKLAIGTLLMTGSVVGAGANVFDHARAAKVVPPFSWGGGFAPLYTLEKFLQVAERVLARRGALLTDGVRHALTVAHERRWTA